MAKILLIEDEVMIREMYEMTFGQRGFDLDSVADGAEAVEILSKEGLDYDLILLDIMMPKMNGVEVLEEIKKEDSPAKDIPVYLLTNLGQENILEAAMKLGAEGSLMKAQYLPNELADEIEKILEKYS